MVRGTGGQDSVCVRKMWSDLVRTLQWSRSGGQGFAIRRRVNLSCFRPIGCGASEANRVIDNSIGRISRSRFPSNMCISVV